MNTPDARYRRPNAQVAISHIYTVYRVNAPVTRIINQVKQDRRTGNLHCLLQIEVL
jgi:hypothetical protein